MSKNVGHILEHIVTAAQYVADHAVPGWKESNYEAALAAELATTIGSGIVVQQQVTLRSYFKTSSGVEVETGALRPDMRVECRCIECDELEKLNLWERQVYVELKLEPKGVLQAQHLEQARGYAIAASSWCDKPVVCLALAFNGKGGIVYRPFSGPKGVFSADLFGSEYDFD